MKIQYLGQAGFLIEGKKARYLIDPYLSDYVITGGYGNADQFTRNFPPPIDSAALANIDAVFITHDHADHCDMDTLTVIKRNNSDCLFVGPQPVRKKLTKYGFGTSASTFKIEVCSKVGNEIEFISVPAAHPSLQNYSSNGEFDCVGYLIKVQGVVVFHSGDTLFYDGMDTIIKKTGWQVDIACLPVNGRDDDREKMGIVGNMNVSESSELAALIDAKWMIPIHNDLFTINQENPVYVDSVLNKAIGIKIVKMTPGQVVDY